MVAPNRAAETIPVYLNFTDNFALRQPGIVAVRLFRDLTMANKFFLHSWWESEEAMLAAAKSEAFGRVLAQAQNDFLERLSVWVLDVIDEDPRPLYPAISERVVSRFLKVTVKPGFDQVMLSEYQRVTTVFSRQQEGCLRVQLFRDRKARNVYFVQSYWSDAEKMLAALSNQRLKSVRSDALRYLEERMTAWQMQIVADSPDRPIFQPVPVIGA